ncbi:MAG: hypothetical protein J2P40_04375 [Candidatus Dormibacteraeota bacterium]|nr:hypothetical protein [Candidatus Dormibacteraeota bacterium]MBO0705351.1 hypothetical protein [Candidatus Dormibacteraeota bacterium]MBO0760492.1 hypothetical protein [Candidatus Dormibacteraeota bacterium]
MAVHPDGRWLQQGLDGHPNGHSTPNSFDAVAAVAQRSAGLVDPVVPRGIAEMLATSRELLSHSWFHYEFMAIACLVAFEAVEATLRQTVYPFAKPDTPFEALVDQAVKERHLGADVGERVKAGPRLRSGLAQRGGQAEYTFAIAEPIVEFCHRVVSRLASSDPS